MVAFIIILIIIAVGALIGLVYYLNVKKYDEFLLENSFCLKQLKDINSRYSFYPYKDFNQEHDYDNEKMYDAISCTDYLIYQLQFISKKVVNQIDKVKSNNKIYSQYLDEIKSITNYGEYISPIGKLKLERLVEREKLLVEKQSLMTPCIQFTITVTLYCTNINGRVYDKKSEEFSINKIYSLIRRLNNKTGNFFNDREIWDSISRVERGKVSNKMRFAIYARDGYRCKKCGVSDRDAQLEIDHIIPIAKGGKTTYDNLQTLCHKCNLEKGDRL